MNEINLKQAASRLLTLLRDGRITYNDKPVSLVELIQLQNDVNILLSEAEKKEVKEPE